MKYGFHAVQTTFHDAFSKRAHALECAVNQNAETVKQKAL